MRDRVAVVFMTLSLVATLVLGGAVVHELGRPSSSQIVTAGGSTGAGATAGGATAGTPGVTDLGGTTGGASSSAGSAGTPGSAATPGHVVVGGTTASGSSTAAGQLSTSTAGASGGVITVGGIYDETGPFDATVERDTVKSYFDTVNATGGVNGYKFSLVDCDSAYDPTVAHQCSQRLVSQNVLAVVGPLSVSGEQPEAQYLNSQGIPIVGGLGVPSEFSVPLSYPVTADITVGGTALGSHAKDLGLKAPGIVLINVNFIKPAEQSLLAALHSHGITQKSVDEVDATKPDYTDLAIKLRSEGVDSVIALLDPFSYARLYQAFDRQSFHPKFLGYGLDKKSAEAQYGSAVYNAESVTPVLEPDNHMSAPEMAAYYGAVKRYYPNQVASLDVYSETDWVGTKLFVEAIRRLGTTPVTRKSLVDSLNAIRNFDTGLTVPLSYSPGASHEANRCFQWIRNQSGTWATYSDWNCF